MPFFKHKEKDYRIDLLFKKKLSYSLLYSLFKQELIVPYNYLLKNLILDKICKSIS